MYPCAVRGLTSHRTWTCYTKYSNATDLNLAIWELLNCSITTDFIPNIIVITIISQLSDWWQLNNYTCCHKTVPTTRRQLFVQDCDDQSIFRCFINQAKLFFPMGTLIYQTSSAVKNIFYAGKINHNVDIAKYFLNDSIMFIIIVWGQIYWRPGAS